MADQAPLWRQGLEEAGDQFLSFDGFPASQHKSWPTPMPANGSKKSSDGESRRKPPLLSEKAVGLGLFGRLASGQVKMCRMEA